MGQETPALLTYTQSTGPAHFHLPASALVPFITRDAKCLSYIHLPPPSDVKLDSFKTLMSLMELSLVPLRQLYNPTARQGQHIFAGIVPFIKQGWWGELHPQHLPTHILTHKQNQIQFNLQFIACVFQIQYNSSSSHHPYPTGEWEVDKVKALKGFFPRG